MTIRTLPIDVYRFPMGDCTNGGISGRFPTLELACEFGNHSFDADVAIPINFCAVEHRSLSGEDCFDIVPATVDENGKIVKRPGWWMAGGNIGYTCDSRFSELTGIHYPLKIHDRKE